MRTNKQNLNEMFGTQEDTITEFQLPDLNETYTTAPVVILSDAPPITDSNIDQDVDYARRTLESLLNRSQQLVEIAIESAEQGQARDIEVAAKTIDTAVSAAERLVELHQKIKDINKNTNAGCGSGNTFVNNQTINVTTSDLLKELRGIKNVT
jgi:hypothetical protein